MTEPKIEIIKSNKTSKKDIQRFYKLNNYSASYIGYDHTYIIKLEDKIIGAVIISYQSENNHYALLHALLVTVNYRHKGYAKQLIKKTLSEHNNLICFTEKGLENLYINNGFKKEAPSRIPDYLIKRYESYIKKSKTLMVFISKKQRVT